MDAPIDKSVLICWASVLSGVNIPTWIHEIVEKPKINDLESESIPLGKREKDTHLFIIAALADKAKISLDEHYSAAKIIQDHLADLGVERAENTIASKLKEARLLLENF